MKTRKKVLAALLIIFVCMFGVIHSANAVSRTFEKTFTSLDEGVFGGLSHLPVIGNTPLEFVITNSTGTTWTDFHLDNESFGGFNAATYDGPGTASFPGATTINLGTLGVFTFSSHMDILGLSIADGGNLNFNNDFFCAGEICSSSFGTFITGYPTTSGGGPSVPEPSTLLLLGSGLAGMAALRRRFTA